MFEKTSKSRPGRTPPPKIKQKTLFFFFFFFFSPATHSPTRSGSRNRSLDPWRDPSPLPSLPALGSSSARFLSLEGSFGSRSGATAAESLVATAKSTADSRANRVAAEAAAAAAVAAAAARAGGGKSARKAGRAEREKVEGDGGEGRAEERERWRRPSVFILFVWRDGSAAARPTARVLGHGRDLICVRRI